MFLGDACWGRTVAGIGARMFVPPCHMRQRLLIRAPAVGCDGCCGGPPLAGAPQHVEHAKGSFKHSRTGDRARSPVRAMSAPCSRASAL
eukprot:364562-Chlamydomonas_euryale.AAC.7